MIPSLLEEISFTTADQPMLWWLGGCGFAVKFHRIIFYVDPQLPEGVRASDIRHADMVLRTHVDENAPDPTTEILMASPRAKVILPKSNAEAARANGISYDRMTTTDADLRVEYFKAGMYGRVYSVPACSGGLHWTPLGGYPYLGYLIRFDRFTIYHAGLSSSYDGLADRLRPYNVTVALLPVGENNFLIPQAAQLAEDIHAEWLAPTNYTDGDASRFTDHMLGHRPSQRFKIFRRGEAWTVPVE